MQENGKPRNFPWGIICFVAFVSGLLDSAVSGLIHHIVFDSYQTSLAETKKTHQEQIRQGYGFHNTFEYGSGRIDIQEGLSVPKGL